MKRRGFVAALGAVMNGTLLRWSERDKRHTAHPRTWLLGERTYIEHAGWSVCVLKGTDETARWQKCETPEGIYILNGGLTNVVQGRAGKDREKGRRIEQGSGGYPRILIAQRFRISEEEEPQAQESQRLADQ